MTPVSQRQDVYPGGICVCRHGLGRPGRWRRCRSPRRWSYPAPARPWPGARPRPLPAPSAFRRSPRQGSRTRSVAEPLASSINPAPWYGCCLIEANKGHAVARPKKKVDCGMSERRIDSVEDILTDPELLRNKTLKEIEELLGATPANWRVERLRRRGSKGRGRVLREYTRDGTETGRMVRYHPGGGRHGPGPYWRVMNSGVKSPIIPAASKPVRG